MPNEQQGAQTPPPIPTHHASALELVAKSLDTLNSQMGTLSANLQNELVAIKAAVAALQSTVTNLQHDLHGDRDTPSINLRLRELEDWKRQVESNRLRTVDAVRDGVIKWIVPIIMIALMIGFTFYMRSMLAQFVPQVP